VRNPTEESEALGTTWSLPWLLCAIALIIVGCSSPDVETVTVPLDVPVELMESLSPSTATEAQTASLFPTPTATVTPTVTAARPASTATATAPSSTPTPPPATQTPNPFADQVTALPAAPQGFDALISGDVAPQPTGLRIDRLDIDAATVIDVGVNDDETFEVPPADEVGWYRFGPSPGQAGSAVLAAHIAFDGVDGVFRHLEDLTPGDRGEVFYDDGSTAAQADPHHLRRRVQPPAPLL